MKKSAIVLGGMVLCIALMLTTLCTDVLAAKAGIAYKIVKNGDNILCIHKKASGNTIYRYNTIEGKKDIFHRDKKAVDIQRISIKGNYLFFQKSFGRDLSKKDGIFRADIITGKVKRLDTGYKYVISGKKIYYQKYNFKNGKWKKRIMNLDGTKKKATKIKAVPKTKESSVAGYKLRSKSYSDGFEFKNWLIVPGGDSVYLGVSID